MKLPKHIGLTIEHQPHALNYETVEQWLDSPQGVGGEALPEDRAEMMATGEVWVIQWYPGTPVGFEAVCAATLVRALDLAMAIDSMGEHDPVRGSTQAKPCGEIWYGSDYPHAAPPCVLPLGHPGHHAAGK